MPVAGCHEQGQIYSNRRRKVADQIHIGFGIDKNFGKFAGVTITSLVHNNIQHDLNIHIVYDQLLPEDMDRL